MDNILLPISITFGGGSLREINKIFLLSGLFCIGTQTDRSIFKDLNTKPIYMAVGLWVVIVPLSLLLVISLI